MFQLQNIWDLEGEIMEEYCQMVHDQIVLAWETQSIKDVNLLPREATWRNHVERPRGRVTWRVCVQGPHGRGKQRDREGCLKACAGA